MTISQRLEVVHDRKTSFIKPDNIFVAIVGFALFVLYVVTWSRKLSEDIGIWEVSERKKEMVLMACRASAQKRRVEEKKIVVVRDLSK